MLLVDAASFAATAAMVAVAVRVAPPVRTTDDREPYGAALRAGLAYLRRDELVLGIALMILATNLLDTAYLTVFAPVWAKEVVGSAKALGLVFGAFGAGAVAGNLMYTALATRLPRYGTFAVCFLFGGAPHMVVLAATDAVWVVAAVVFLSGFVSAPVNPILAAMAYERIPPEFQARVIGLIRALAWAGIPLGGLLGGLLVTLQGLTGALVLAAVLYLAITLTPFVRPRWRALDTAG